jgi:hypothetical protein
MALIARVSDAQIHWSGWAAPLAATWSALYAVLSPSRRKPTRLRTSTGPDRDVRSAQSRNGLVAEPCSPARNPHASSANALPGPR